jgi:hypothetical protein
LIVTSGFTIAYTAAHGELYVSVSFTVIVSGLLRSFTNLPACISAILRPHSSCENGIEKADAKIYPKNHRTSLGTSNLLLWKIAGISTEHFVELKGIIFCRLK